MWAKTMTEGSLGIPGQAHDEVAETVGAMLEAQAVEVRRDGARDALLVPRQPGDAHQLDQEVPDHRGTAHGRAVRISVSAGSSASTNQAVSPAR